ncbi:hypothetical protein MRX96_032713 [Rhipicephalus microplus]
MASQHVRPRRLPPKRIFNPEDENDMEEILKLLDSSDIEFSDDDDDELAQIQNREPNQPGGDSNSDNDEDIDHSVPAPSASGDQSTTPASNNRGRTFWMKKPFPKKPDPPGAIERADVLVDVKSPLSYFSEYFSEQFFENAAEKTNMYHMSKHGKALQATAQKVKQLFGMHLVMGCIRFPQLHMYWKRGYHFDLISSVMTREEFKKLRSSLHFVDTEKPREADDVNRLWKVQPIIDAVRTRCTQLERAPRCYSVDEQMIPFTGRCPLRQYVKGKPRPLGLKNFVVTTSEGLVMDFEIYQGKSTPLAETSLGLGPNAVLRLVRTLPEKSSIFFDRYFTTIPLLDELLKKGIDGTGTIMANRIRSVRFRSDSEMKQGDLDELTRNDEKVAIVKWKDSKTVLLASTCAGATNVEPVKRWSKKEKKYIDVPAPEVVRRYNASMGGVDTCDQLIEYYRVAVKTKKWTLKVSLHMVDLAIANCWLEYRDACRKDAVLRRNTMSLLDFRLAVAEALCASPKRKRLESNNENVQPNHSTERSPGAAKIPGVDKRLDSYDHWPSVDSLSSARCCRLAGCTSRTRTRCEKCNVYLCLSSDKNCFKVFHTRH